ncbi:hypothetical protein BWI17_02240 [Betaproteobacteria bacterium GR16-43]|nr:hypothetical protein BWI17_02240 [Betaproteobacteria bacterium GR16-43]
MPSHGPRQDATKKREQLSRRKEALTRAIQENQSREVVLRAAEEYRTSYLSFLKAKLHLAKEALVVGTVNLGKNAGSLRLKAASVTAQSDVDRFESEIAKWSAMSMEDVLHEQGPA